MATFNLTQRSDFTAPFYKHSQEVNDQPVRLRSGVFSGADAAVFKGSAVGTGDIYQVLTIPANALVLSVSWSVITAEGATSTFNLGDTATASGYVSGANSNAVAVGQSFNATTTPAYGVGKFYSTADSLNLALASGTAANAVIKVSMAYIEMKPLAA